MGIATITIGGENLEVPELNFKALKKVFPIIKRMKVHTVEAIEDDPELAFSAVDECLEIISIALARSKTPMSFEQLEDKILASELPGLQPVVSAILTANGLTVKAGELKAVSAGAAKNLMETSTQLSAKSSQDLDPQTGT